MSDTDVLFKYLQRDPGGQKTLLIKHLSPEMDHDSLMANLMHVCRIDVANVYIMTESPGVALARFSKDIPDIQKLQKRVLERGFNGVYPILTFLVESVDDSCLAHCVHSSERQVTAAPLPISEIRSSGLLFTTEQSPSLRAEAAVRPVTAEPLPFLEERSSGLLFTTEQSPSLRTEAAVRPVTAAPLPISEIRSSGLLFTTEQSPSLRAEAAVRPVTAEPLPFLEERSSGLLFTTEQSPSLRTEAAVRPVTAAPLPISEIRSSGLLFTTKQSPSLRAETAVRPVTAEPLPFSEERSSGLLFTKEQSPSLRAEAAVRPVTAEPLPFSEEWSSGLLFTKEHSPNLQAEASDQLFTTEYACGYPQIVDADLIKSDFEHPALVSPYKDQRCLPVATVSPLMTRFGETETESILSYDDEFQNLCSEKCDPVTCDDIPADLYSEKETLQTDKKQNLEPTSTQSLQIGSIRLEIKKGRIARQEAEVLVNVVSPVGELVGSVSQAFIANGGPSFPVLYDSVKDADSSKRLVCTEGSGRLKCSEVFHVRLERQQLQTINAALQEIFLECESKGYSTLAMPPLGIGQMYGYSPDTVADRMLTYLSQYGEKTDRSMQIGIVILDSDDETYRVFCDELVPHVTVRDNSGLQNKSTHDDRVCSPRMPEAFQQPAVMPRFTRQAPSRRSEASLKGGYQQTQKSTQNGTLHRDARRQEETHASKRDDRFFIQQIPKAFQLPTETHSFTRQAPSRRSEASLKGLYQQTQKSREKAMHDGTPHRSARRQEDILTSALDDRFLFKQTPETFQLPTETNSFTRQTPSWKSEGLYQQTQKSREKATHDGTRHRTERKQADTASYQRHDLARNKGHKEYRKSKKSHTQDRMNRNEDKENALRFAKDKLGREFDIPPYWKIFHHEKSLKERFLGFVGKGHKFKRINLPAESRTYHGIVSMVESTFDRSKIGMGKDAVGLRELRYSKLSVIKIERIENPELFEKYDGKRKDLFKQLIGANEGNFPPIAALPGSSGAVQLQDYVQKNIENDIHPQLNEMLLFHGTRSKYVDAICNEGPDFRLGCHTAMFGQGIYSAECSQKADQYADDPNHRTGDTGEQKTMFLLRILLGNAFLCSAKDPPKYRRPPCTKTSCFKDDCSKIHHTGKFGHSFHSVVGDTGRLFREFVVYEKVSCYPEYLITYERL